MNLAKLFDMQRELGKVGLFVYKGPDRFNKLVLALLVELGECANEWRGFKFWSLNQNPVTYKREHKKQIKPGLESFDNHEGAYETVVIESNPLLEEYVDGLHFVLELGIELGFKPITVRAYKYEDVTRQFKELFWEISDLDKLSKRDEYIWTFQKFVGLGEMLGFTWEEIEQAYMEKNKVNHQRQSEGY